LPDKHTFCVYVSLTEVFMCVVILSLSLSSLSLSLSLSLSVSPLPCGRSRGRCGTGGPSATTVRSTTCGCCRATQACTSTQWSTAQRERPRRTSPSTERTPSPGSKVGEGG